MALTHVPDPRFLVGQSEHWSILLNIDQSLLGRCYLSLKRLETNVLALRPEEITNLWATSARVVKALDLLWYPDHFNYAFLMNQDPHVHWHVIPRYKGRREFAGGTFVDPEFGGHYGLGVPRTLEDAGYEAILADLRQRLS